MPAGGEFPGETVSEVVEITNTSAFAVADIDTQVVETSGGIYAVEVGYSQPGGSSGGSGGAGYYAEQFQVANTTFTVNHNLGQFPAVTFVDSAGQPIQGDVDYVNANTVTITFTAAESGWVYCNLGGRKCHFRSELTLTWVLTSCSTV